jgi:hypothetical protein
VPLIEVAVGTVLGAIVAETTAWIVRRDERQHVRTERVQERQRSAVEELDRALEKAHSMLPAFTSKQVGAAEYWAAQTTWQDGLFRAAPYVRDRELITRYDAAGWALLTAALDSENELGADEWIVLRAIDNARSACQAFVLEEPLPERTFPSRGEAAGMARLGRDGRNSEPLHAWLHEHPSME